MKAVHERVETGGRASWKYFVRSEPHFPYTWHFHREYELTLITEGGGRRFVGDSIERYGPGDLALIGADLPHSWASDGGGRNTAVVLQFDRDFLGPQLLRAPEFARVGALLDESARGLVLPDGDAGAARRMTAMQTLAPAARTIALLALLDTLADRGGGRSLASPGFSPRLGEIACRRTDTVCRYLAEHYAEPLTLADAAAVAHLSPSAFSRFFHRNTGKTFTRYLAELRIGAAEALLADADPAVTRVAQAVGFHNLSNFNRWFRQLTGTSPTAYRREALGRGPGRPAETVGTVATVGTADRAAG